MIFFLNFGRKMLKLSAFSGPLLYVTVGFTVFVFCHTPPPTHNSLHSYTSSGDPPGVLPWVNPLSKEKLQDGTRGFPIAPVKCFRTTGTTWRHSFLSSYRAKLFSTTPPCPRAFPSSGALLRGSPIWVWVFHMGDSRSWALTHSRSWLGARMAFCMPQDLLQEPPPKQQMSLPKEGIQAYAFCKKKCFLSS